MFLFSHVLKVCLYKHVPSTYRTQGKEEGFSGRDETYFLVFYDLDFFPSLFLFCFGF